MLGLFSLQPTIAMHQKMRMIEHGQEEAKETMQKIIEQNKKLKKAEKELELLINTVGEKTILDKEQIKKDMLLKAKKLKQLKDIVWKKK